MHHINQLVQRFCAKNVCTALTFAGCLAASLLSAQDDLAELEERAMQAAVARVSPSVLRIETVGGMERIGEFLVGEGPTTGVAVAEDGYVISSAFNFAQEPTSILVTMPSGQRAAAKIVARDDSRMLVLLKVDSEEKLKVPEPVPLDEIRVGQWALAVGRTLDPRSPNSSTGIISAKNRIWGRAIQTDAKISPSNYGGALIDIRGRVFGLLVPMSPQGGGALAGADWYDSGIGFAIPLADVGRNLESLKSGEDLHPGLLGIVLEPGSQYSIAPKIKKCKVRSPAENAGLKAGDVIIEVAGQPITSQVELKHALGPLYAGEEVVLVVRRDGQPVETKVTLAERVPPYEQPFLGLLPVRGILDMRVREVFADSGSADAGLQAGDHIMEFDGKPVASASELRDAVSNFEPRDRVALKFQRDDEPQSVEVVLGRLPESIPTAEPVVANEEAAEPVAEALVEQIEVKIAGEPNDCPALVPKSGDDQTPLGLLICLYAPGDFEREEFPKQWSALAKKHGLIVAAPQPADPRRWKPTEVEFIRKVVDDIVKNHPVDPTRVVIQGRQAGGSMAFLSAFQHRDVFRGVVAIDAAVPGRVAPPETDPVQRLAIVIAKASKSPISSRIDQVVEALRQLEHPVTVIELDEDATSLSDQQRSAVVRWVDSLDRI